MAKNILEIVLQASGGRQVKTELKGAEKAIDMAKKAVLGLGVAFTAREVLQAGLRMADLASEARAVESAFTSLSGGAILARQNMEAMGVATRDLVSETEQQRIASQLLGMGIVDNARDLGEFVHVARRLGGTFRNLGAAEAANEFALMQANMSYQRLDSFGISAGNVRARVAELKATVEGMTTEAAFFQASMEEAQATLARLGPEVDTLKTASDELDAAAGDLGVTLGTILAPGATTAKLAIADLARSLDAVLTGQVQPMDIRILSLTDSYETYATAMQNAARTTGQSFNVLTRAQFDAFKVGQSYSHETELMGARMTAYAMTHSQVALAIDAVADAYEDAHFRARSLGPLSSVFGGDSGSVTGGAGFLDFIDAESSEFADRRADEQKRANEEIADHYQREMERANDRLTSAIESAIAPTLSQVWAPPADDQRMDEDARRLATVFGDGFNSEWLAQLNQRYRGMDFWQPIADAMESGDTSALQTAAQNILTGGALTQLWDVELIKERVRQDLQMQDARAQLIRTVMSELSAEGTQVDAGSIQAAMGVTPVAGTVVNQLQSGLPEAMGKTNIGGEMINIVDNQIKKSGEDMKALTKNFVDTFHSFMPEAFDETTSGFLEQLVDHVAKRLGTSTGGTGGAKP